MKRFFLLWNPTHPDPPKFRFETKKEARDVADELAREKPGTWFYILRAEDVVVSRVEVISTKLEGGK